MSRKERTDEASSWWDSARRAAAQLKPVAGRVKPLARSTGAAGRRQLRRTRVLAAPQVARAGQVLQDSVAPKVSALLSSAAQRIEPAEPRRRRGRKAVGMATLVAAAIAVAALVRNRMKVASTTPAAVDADAVPAPETRDVQAAPSTRADADANARVRAS